MGSGKCAKLISPKTEIERTGTFFFFLAGMGRGFPLFIFWFWGWGKDLSLFIEQKA